MAVEERGEVPAAGERGDLLRVHGGVVGLAGEAECSRDGSRTSVCSSAALKYRWNGPPGLA